MQLSAQDSVWNRAALEAGGSAPLDGDVALAAALAAHGLVMNGGVAQTCQVLTREQCLAAIAGFRYFGLNDAARVLETALTAPAIDPSSYDRDYWSAVPNDDVLTSAFSEKYRNEPCVFAPLDHMPNKSLERTREG